jgi:WD40-like Beta Propeller Repeat
LLAVSALAGGLACGRSSRAVANAGANVTFSRGGDIYVMRGDGSGERRLTRSEARDIAPSGSPDGRRIAFASDRGGRFEVYVINAGGGGGG